MDTNKPRSGFGPLKDLENLKQNGSLAIDELREFLRRLQGRSPQEVVGIVSTSLMVQSMVLATIASLAILVVFTVGPYMLYGPPQVKKLATPPQPAAAPAQTAATPATAGKTDESPVDDRTKALQKMGTNETKTADPKTNPLDKNFDNLLDNVK